MPDQETSNPKNWTLCFSFEERVKFSLTPPALAIRRKVNKELHKGEKELRLVPFLADKNRNCVDAGACWGVYSYVMAQYCPHVYAFEPNPKVFKVTQRLARKNVTVFPLALSNKPGSARLQVPKGKRGYSNQGSSLREGIYDSREYATVDIETKPLDAMGIKNIGFIKIDVEGFELQVLEGAAATLQKDRPTLLIEIEERHTGIPIEEAISQVEHYGYTAMFLRNGRLSLFENFDAEKFHRTASSPDDYVFNFIFLPK